MEKILISSCLLGQPVRYDGGDARCRDSLIAQWHQQQRLIPICPEMSGGLPCPRPAAEISGGQGRQVLDGETRVLTRDSEDVSEAFIRGAGQALALCREHDIHIAILKARSPSCGSRQTYDGSFSGTLVDGRGVTAALLQACGIRTFDEQQLAEAERWLRQLESR